MIGACEREIWPGRGGAGGGGLERESASVFFARESARKRFLGGEETRCCRRLV